MAEPKTIRILAVDDHEMVRKGIRFTLLSVNDIEMIGEAMSGEEALEICDQEAPDVVIMDMMLPFKPYGTVIPRSRCWGYPAFTIAPWCRAPCGREQLVFW